MRVLLAITLMLAGCSKSSDVLEELPNSSLAGAPREDVPEARLESDLRRAVTIGEDGPRLDACGATGQAARVGVRGLPVRAAPFTEARDCAAWRRRAGVGLYSKPRPEVAGRGAVSCLIFRQCG